MPQKIKTAHVMLHTFRMDVKKENCDSILTCSEVNERLTRFFRIYNRVSNKHALFKTAKIRHKTYKPWIASGLRDKFYKRWLTTHITDFEIV